MKTVIEHAAKWAVRALLLLAFALTFACQATREPAMRPATLTFGIVCEEDAPPENRTGPFAWRAVGGAAVHELYLEREPLTVRPAQVVQSTDHSGMPAVSVSFAGEDAARFEAFTARNVDRTLVILIDGVVVSVAVIAEPLPANVQISAGFSQAQVDELIARLSR
ncbi:MAG: hypothetical protein HZA52_09460 [Planctomycetes bacterium]|nr:hypothetical protein [Planctomycetota bacterium]